MKVCHPGLLALGLVPRVPGTHHTVCSGTGKLTPTGQVITNGTPVTIVFAGK